MVPQAEISTAGVIIAVRTARADESGSILFFADGYLYGSEGPQSNRAVTSL
jgi:hypothetical protein